MPRELTQAELADLLRSTERSTAKPAPPVSMRAVLARGLVAGGGACLLLGGLLYWQGAPLDTLANAPLVAGVMLAGGVMLLSAFPTEKIAPALLTVRRIQAVQAAVNAAEFRKRKAYEVIQQMEAEHAAQAAEWQRALAELRNENKALRSDLRRYQESARTPTFVTRSQVAEETVKDATAILEHWFATLRPDRRGEMRGDWLSRPKAMASGWTKTRHADAAQLLLDAGVTMLNEKLPAVKPEFGDAGAALYRLHTHVREAAQEPDMPRRQDGYVEPE